MAFNKLKTSFLAICATSLVGATAYATAPSSSLRIGVFNTQKATQSFFETLPTNLRQDITHKQLWLNAVQSPSGSTEHQLEITGLTPRKAKDICKAVKSRDAQCVSSIRTQWNSSQLSEPAKLKEIAPHSPTIPKFKTTNTSLFMLKPLEIRLTKLNLENGIDLDRIQQNAPFKISHQQNLATYHQNFSIEPASDDTPKIKATKAAYNTARNRFVNMLHQIAEGVNAGEGEDTARAELMALGRELFEVAGNTYLSGFLARQVGQAKALSQEAGAGDAFIHHVQKNIDTNARATVEGLISDVLSSASGTSEMEEDLLKAATDRFIVSGAQGLIDAGLSAARRSDLYALRHMELEYNLNDFKNSYFSALLTQPVYQSADLRHNVFLQGGGILNEQSVDIDDDENRHTLNIGAAYRYLTIDEKYLLGGNIFFDHQWPYNHSRMSIGVDAKAQNLNLAANYYHPLTDFRGSRVSSAGIQYEERALKGYDVELGYTLPFLPDMSVFGKGYQYFRETDDDIRGLELSAEHNIRDNFVIKGAFVEENGGRDGAEFGVQYRMPLYDADKPNIALAAIKTAAGNSSARSKIFDKVRRENRIRVEERVKSTDDAAALVTAQFNAASLGLPFTVGGAAMGAGINLAFDTAITIPNGGFGIINFSNGAIANVSASGGGNVILEFNNSTLTVTATNGGFVQFISGSGGISTVNVPGGTVNLLGTDIDVTDDGTTTTVQVRAGQIEVVPDVGVAILNGNQADIVSLTIASGATSLLVNPALETRQEEAFTNLDLINPAPPTDISAAPFINALPALITGPQFVGNNADLRLTFTQAVTVAGTPFINALVDATARTFSYDAAASSSTQLVFRHIYVAGDTGAAAITINELDLNGGTIIGTSNALTAITAFTQTIVPITDQTAPMLTGSTPADNEPAFAASSNIVLNFDENMQAGIGNITITDTTDGSSTLIIPIGDAQINIAGSTLTINPTAPLDLSTDYDLTIPAGVIEDTSGNDFAGITTTNLNFTTSNDITPPTLMSSTPADDAVNAALNDNIVLTFDEIVNKGTGNIEIRRTDNDALLETIDVTTGLVTGGGTTTITINPANDYPAATDVYVLIAATAFDDLFGNSFAGIAAKTTLNFRGFAPLDIVGIELWLDAADVTATGTNPAPGVLTTWADKSGGNNNATQGSAGNRPTSGTRTLNGLNVLDFDGGNDNMSGAVLGLASYTKFVVFERDTNGASNTIGRVTGNGDALFRGSADRLSVFHNGTFINSSIINTGQAYIGGATSDTVGNAELFINGISEGTGTRAIGVGGSAYEVGGFNGAANLINGTIAEIIVYNNVLTPAEYAQVNTYLTNKWAIP